MRVLHVVKTAIGAGWAADQAAQLITLGTEVHVALPSDGRTAQKWNDSGATIHIVPTDLPIRNPWLFPKILRNLRDLVSTVKPDLIHSHFFGSTVLLRLALGPNHPVPRVFQVPGPLHLEHPFWRNLELSTAGPSDFWIGSSRCILAHYRSAGLPPDRLYLSYYGIPDGSCQTVRTGLLRTKYAIPPDIKIIGNANFMYSPKWYLGHRVGLKAHEDVIEALGIVLRHRKDVIGVLIGGGPKPQGRYERRLRNLALETGGGRILMAGYLPVEHIREMWPDFDLAVHVPISENCGGVGEPMLSGVPVVAGRIGGLPELVIDGLTGTLVSVRRPKELAEAVLRILDSLDYYKELARRGQNLVRSVTSMKRIGAEILSIYSHITGNARTPFPQFDPIECLVSDA